MMSEYQYAFSSQTRLRFWLVLMLILIGLAVTFSSIYFLYFPVGFQGGRNPYYSRIVIFNREDWSLIHLWSGLAMIIVVLIHIPVHWKWIKNMFAHCFKKDSCDFSRLNKHAQLNIFLDALSAVSFLFAAGSGMYLLFAPNGKHLSTALVFIFNYQTWDFIHTWSGVVMIIASLFHFLYHWIWVVKVSSRILKKEKIPAFSKSIK